MKSICRFQNEPIRSHFKCLLLPVLLSLCVKLGICGTSTEVITNGHFEVLYTQTTSAVTSLDLYRNTIRISGRETSEIDPPIEHLPVSITFGGSPIFPSGEIELEIKYGQGINRIRDENYYASTGYGKGASYNPTLFYHRSFSGTAFVQSSDYAEVQGPLTVTLNGGNYDGYTASLSHNLNLLPDGPLLTDESLLKLGGLVAHQAVTLAFINPLSSSFVSSFYLEEYLHGDLTRVYSQDLDPIFNPNGFDLPAGIIVSGRDYLLTLMQHHESLEQREGAVAYSFGNTISFSVESVSTPENGDVIYKLAVGLLGLAAFRRKLITR